MFRDFNYHFIDYFIQLNFQKLILKSNFDFRNEKLNKKIWRKGYLLKTWSISLRVNETFTPLKYKLYVLIRFNNIGISFTTV